MTYVQQFKHDVFISYAHADDALDPQGVQWVSDFQVYLRRAIKQHLAGYEPSIYFDALDLHPNQPIKTVLDNARQSAVFLPIISPSYIERPWPNDELQAFNEALTEPRRIFAVELLPPIGSYPFPLSTLRRKEFWWRDEKQGSAPRRLTPKCEARTYTDYLDDIAYLIAKQLREMAQAGEQHEMKRPRCPGKVVLLAEVTDDLRRTVRQVREHLEQYEFYVLPTGDYPEGSTEFLNAFNADLAQADIFVQLLSEVRTIRSPDFKDAVDGEPKSQGQYQYDAAKRRGIPILQWRSPEIDPSTVMHWDRRLLLGPDVLAIGLQEFIRQIKTVLDRPRNVTSNKPGLGEILFINADRSDKQLAEELLKAFEGDPNWVAMEPLFEGTAEQILEDLEANLTECAGLVLVYGSSTPPWVRAQLRRYNKIEKSRQQPLRTKRILIGPPAPKSEWDIGLAGGFTKMDCQNGISAQALEELVKELHG